MGRTAARADLTASEAGRCCDEQDFRALGGLWVYTEATWGTQIGKLRCLLEYDCRDGVPTNDPGWHLRNAFFEKFRVNVNDVKMSPLSF